MSSSASSPAGVASSSTHLVPSSASVSAGTVAAAAHATAATALPFERLRYALAGGICASFNHFILVPIDVIKTKIQVNPVQYHHVGQTARAVIAANGWRGLTLGMTPTVIGYALQGGFKFGVYEAIRAGTPKEQQNTWTYLRAAAIGEMTATVALSPWEALRIKMVADPSFARSTPTGMARIAREEGFAGFYRGLLPLAFKQLPYTIVQLVVFSHLTNAMYAHILPTYMGVTKERMSPASMLAVSLASGAVAGVTSSLASQPGDTVLTKINTRLKMAAAQGSAAGGAAPVKVSIADVVRELGFRGLWLGAGTRAGMTAVLSAGMFLVYDSVKLALGLPTSGGH